MSVSWSTDSWPTGNSRSAELRRWCAAAIGHLHPRRWAPGTTLHAGQTGFTVMGERPAQYLSNDLTALRGPAGLPDNYISAGAYPGHQQPSQYVFSWPTGFATDGTTIQAANAPIGLGAGSGSLYGGAMIDTDGDGHAEVWYPMQDGGWYLTRFP